MELKYGVHLLPLSVSDSLDVDCLVALPVGEGEDEDSVPQPIRPRSLHDVPVRILVLACSHEKAHYYSLLSILDHSFTLSVLLAVAPVSIVDVAIGEEVLAVTVPLVPRELSHVLVPGVRPHRPPKLAETFLHAVDIVSLNSIYEMPISPMYSLRDNRDTLYRLPLANR